MSIYYHTYIIQYFSLPGLYLLGEAGGSFSLKGLSQLQWVVKHNRINRNKSRLAPIRFPSTLKVLDRTPITRS